MKTIQLTALMAGLFFSTFHAPAQSAPFLTNGLIAYYPFNGNANDASGNGNGGIVSGATLTADRFGVASNAYLFAALGDNITTTNANGFPVSTNDFTVSLWVNVSSNSGLPEILINNEALEQFQIHIWFEGQLQTNLTSPIGFQSGGTGAGFSPAIA